MQLDPGRNRGATPAARAAFALEQHARLIGTADASQIPITASFGVAVSAECDPLDTEELLRLADEALY